MLRWLVIVLLTLVGCAKPNPLQVAMENTVMVLAEDGSGGGSGFFLFSEDKSIVITAGHVCEDFKTARVKIPGIGEIVYPVLISDHDTDVCVLYQNSKVWGKGEPWGLKLQPKRYFLQPAYAAGFPRLSNLFPTQGLLLNTETVNGYTSADPEKGCEDKTKPPIFAPFAGFICSKAYVNTVTSILVIPGMSGGPAINEQYEVVGMLVANKAKVIGLLTPTEQILQTLKKAKL